MNRNAIRLLALPILSFLVNYAYAICTHPEPLAKTKYSRADDVFLATVLAVRYGPSIYGPYAREEGDEEDKSGTFYTVNIEKTFRGQQKNTLEIYEENASSRMGLSVGHSYLLYLTKTRNDYLQGSCYDAVDSGDPGFNDQINVVERLSVSGKSINGSEIRGYVAEENPFGNALNGVRFVIKSDKHEYRAKSDENGYFYLQVPPGRYMVDSFDSNWIIMPTDYSYDKADNLVVEKNRTYEVSFQARKNQPLQIMANENNASSIYQEDAIIIFINQEVPEVEKERVLTLFGKYTEDPQFKGRYLVKFKAGLEIFDAIEIINREHEYIWYWMPIYKYFPDHPEFYPVVNEAE